MTRAGLRVGVEAGGVGVPPGPLEGLADLLSLLGAGPQRAPGRPHVDAGVGGLDDFLRTPSLTASTENLLGKVDALADAAAAHCAPLSTPAPVRSAHGAHQAKRTYAALDALRQVASGGAVLLVSRESADMDRTSDESVLAAT